MGSQISRTAEHVSAGHPDKYCDQVADRVLDEALRLAADEGGDVLPQVRTAIECLVKDNLLIISGEVKLTDHIKTSLDPSQIARDVWAEIGYSDNSDELTVICHLRNQSPDIAQGTDVGGAGDQGIMVGYATDENPEMVPTEWLLARNLCRRLHDLRASGELSWLRSDCKSQVSIDADGRVSSVIVAAQHAPEVTLEEIREAVLKTVIQTELEVDPQRVTINGTGKFVIGGPTGDAGVVGRKIVVDAYGPRVPVGGGAYSGKDPSKVDRSAAYMARHLAKAVVAHKIGEAHDCTVKLAYGIGKHQPEMVSAVTDSGKDVSSWVKEKFTDLSPTHIISSLGLLTPNGWSYYKTASYGHYGRDDFPWEKVANV